MSDTIYLYLKTHNETGLKYFGMTKQDPFKYMGSGKRWRNHLSKHGNDVDTKIIFESKDKDEISKIGKKYSYIWDIVNSTQFANLKIEEGDGGFDHINNDPINNKKRLKSLRESLKSPKEKRKPTSGSFKLGDKRVKEISKIANDKKREMIKNGETDNWKCRKGIQTKSTLGHKWYRNLETGEKSMFINKEVPVGWITSDEYKEINYKSKKRWYHNDTKNFLLDYDNIDIKELNLIPGRVKF